MTLVELWYSTLVPIWRNSSVDVNRSAEFPLLSLRTFRYTPPTIFTARQQSCGKIMFSVVSVCHSVCQQGPHVTTVSWGPPSPQPRPWTPARGSPGPSSEYLDLFKFGQYVAYTSVGKRTIGIRLKCVLV